MFEELKRLEGVQSAKWYVVFTDSETLKYPFKFFTRPGFEHCFCLAETPAGTLIVNYTDFYAEIRFAVGVSASYFACALVNEGCRVLQVTTDRKVNFYFRGFIYCVNLVKSFLGLRGCYAITPFGLFKWLKESNLLVIDLNEKIGSSHGRSQGTETGSGADQKTTG